MFVLIILASNPFVFSCEGSSTDPCVLRCMDGNICTFTSPIIFNASYAWIWGMTVTVDAVLK